MTYQISKNVNTHVILTYAGSKHFITAQQEQALRRLSDKDRFYLEDRMIRVNTIKEIMPVDDYYKFNPDEKPYHSNLTYPDFQSGQIDKILSPIKVKEKRIRALKSMIAGFKKVFTGREMPKRSKIILEKMEEKLSLALTS